MKNLLTLLPVKLAAVLLCVSPLLASVTLTSPVNGTTSSSPVHFAASATSTCRKGVTTMGIYVNNQLSYTTHGSNLDTQLTLAVGSYHTVVQAWDHCGDSSTTAADITVGNSGGVTVTSPASGSKVTSPVTFIANAQTTACAQGVASMGVYVDNALKYVVNGTTLNTQIPLSGGPQSTVVQEWDYCGGASKTPVPVTVGGGTTSPGAIKHVFVIVLENKGYAETFGSGSAAPYLAQTLTSQGQLLTNYFGTAHNSDPNYVAMVSGQAPNPETQADCQPYSDFVGPQNFTGDGQIVGHGCVYPASVNTIANQLEQAGLTWRGYMEGMGSPCLHPRLNGPDPYRGATPDGYATKHNPFVYFHSLIDTSSCAANDVALTNLQQDLSSVATTPNLSYIVPNICHDGHDSPCNDGEPGGLVSADAFLKQWVPAIMNSPAYQQDGVLIITFDEAESGSDSSACCNEQPGPNAGQPGLNGPGGGLVGAVVLSPFVTPGTQNGTGYNHYSLLKTMEGFFGLSYLGEAQQSGLAAFGTDVFGQLP